MEHLPDITQLSRRVIRVLGQNGSAFTLQGTNCYLVGTGPSRILIDTGSGLAAFQELLQTAMKQFSILDLSCVILTHHHIDHIGGIKRLLTVNQSPVIVVYTADLGSVWRESDGRLEYRQTFPGMLIDTDGATLECLPAPGHTGDSMCLFLREENALFSGDTVLGDGKAPVIDHLGDYLASLESLRSRLQGYTQPTRIYPGHGQVIVDGVTSLSNLIARRSRRTDEIVAVLRNRPYIGAVELVGLIYHNVPAELRLAALGTVKRHLEYLQEEGVVVHTDKGFALSDPFLKSMRAR